jgi:hypothetical protein
VRDVPIESGDPIIVNFSNGAGGDAEGGEWAFWTIFNDEKICTARCRPDADPGERFWRSMVGRPNATEYWPYLFEMIIGRNPSLKRALSRFAPDTSACND